MVGAIFGLGVLVTFVWFLSTRATAVYGAFLAGYFTHQFGAHWITVIIAAAIGYGLVYGLLYILTAMAAKRAWAGILVLALVCIPPFLIGYNVFYGFMTSEGQNASSFEGAIAGVLAGIVTAGAAFGAYQRDMAAMSDR